jgi:translation initiation factor IF-3
MQTINEIHRILEEDYNVKVATALQGRKITGFKYADSGKKVTKQAFIKISQDLRSRGLSLIN